MMRERVSAIDSVGWRHSQLHGVHCVILMALIIMLSQSAMAFEKINKSYFGGLALGGYDAVSYFVDAKANKGSDTYFVQWKGAKWLFSSDANRKLFVADPKAFAPQYGGHCSNQMSLGNLSDIDPEVWRIIGKKLYLFGHDAGRVRWANETKQRIADANQHWRAFLAR